VSPVEKIDKIEKTDEFEAAECSAQEGAVAVESGLGADQEFLQALLSMHRHLELPDLLGALLEPSRKWCGAEFGIGLGASGEGRAFIPLAASVSMEDPRVGAFSRVAPERLKKWLSSGAEVFEGLGPFDAIVTDWPGDAPGYCLGVPVAGPEDKWAAVLLLISTRKPAKDEIHRLTRLIRMGRWATGNALRLLAMRELVIKDDTARCFNRRHFEEFLPEELSRASRFRSPVSLIFLDLDNLKQVNNKHGHSMGSRILYEVSVRVRSKIRRFDKLFRFGGDEFCIVLPETEWHGALEVAERVREVISAKPLLSRVLEGNEGVAMSASLGIASFPLHARNQRDLVQTADRAMQKVKLSGKNAIGIAEIAGDDDGE
jgi:diguanylate cyclase (GGDEF)-like protein